MDHDNDFHNFLFELKGNYDARDKVTSIRPIPSGN